MPAKISIKDLLEAGAHFGHQTRRWNPKMKPYIFIERNGIHIIDLQKTLDLSHRAYDAVKATVERGETVLFVGTKKQAKTVVEEEAQRCGMYYVTERWLGGMLTNFQTIRKSLARLKEVQKMSEDGSLEQLSKKERIQVQKERGKLEKALSGIANLERLPGLLYVIDTKKEEIAVKEANKLRIPIVGVVDTNADPDLINYPLPGNDDAIRAIRLFTALVADAVLEGRERWLEGREADRLSEGASAKSAADTASDGDDRRERRGGPRPRGPRRDEAPARIPTTVTRPTHIAPMAEPKA
jgi:small subunit ribosomal protein S2